MDEYEVVYPIDSDNKIGMRNKPSHHTYEPNESGKHITMLRKQESDKYEQGHMGMFQNCKEAE